MFNSHLAYKMFGVETEEELRSELYGTRSDLTQPERDSIINCLNEFESPKYCEVGVYFGGNFDKILSWLGSNKENYFCYGVDLFEDLSNENQGDQTHDLFNKWNILNVAYRESLSSALESRERKNFELLKGNSHIVVSEMEEPCDVYFLDGNHTYAQTRLDAMACIEKANPGAYLVFHNASKDIPPDDQYVARDGGPWQVCEELSKQDNIEYVGLFDRCAVLRITND